MRRYRDYHLNVATWYTVILLAVFGEILTVKFGSVQPGLSQLLSTNLAVKTLIAVFTTLIGISGCYSVLYASWRYDELRKYVDDYLEPSWKNFKPKKMKITPQEFMLLTQILLVIAIDIVAIWGDEKQIKLLFNKTYLTLAFFLPLIKFF